MADAGLPGRRRTRRGADRRPFLLLLGMGLVRLARWPIARSGADYRVVRTILETKLTIDLRRGGLFKHELGHRRGGLLATVLMLLLAGAMLSLGALVPTLFMAGSLLSAGIVYVVVLVLLVDYAGLIINPADDQIIGPCPVDDRTLLVSQLVHLGVFMSIITASVSLIPLIVGVARHGLVGFVPGFLPTVVLAGALGVLGVVVIYLGVSRLVGPERSPGALVGLQIVMTVGLMGAAQLTRLIDRELVTGMLDGDGSWLLLVPPCWFGGLFEVLAGSTRLLHLALAGCAVLVPLGALWLAVSLSTGRVRSVGLVAARTARSPRAGLVRRLGAAICRSPPERAGFDQFVSLATRERGYRLRTYPALAYPFIMFLVPIFSGGHEAVMWRSFLVYGGLFFVVPLVVQARYSDDHEAGWLFGSVPLERPGEVLAGTIKGLCATFLLPWVLIAGIVGVATGGAGVLFDVALGAEVVLLVTVLAADALLPALPFTRRFNQSEMTSQLGIMFMVFIGGAGLGFVHYLVSRHALSHGLALGLLAWLVVWRFGHLSRRRRLETG